MLSCWIYLSVILPWWALTWLISPMLEIYLGPCHDELWDDWSLLCWRYTWDPAMISVDMIDLSCTGAHHAIMLEIQYTWDPAMMSVDMIDLSMLEMYLGSCHDECWHDWSLHAGDTAGSLPWWALRWLISPMLEIYLGACHDERWHDWSLLYWGPSCHHAGDCRKCNSLTQTHGYPKIRNIWVDIQRWGSILVWIVTLSVCGAYQIAIDLSLSALISWFIKYCGFLNNSTWNAIISTLLIINLHGVKKMYFAVLEEISINVCQ